jgi:fimbrial chaperone protein
LSIQRAIFQDDVLNRFQLFTLQHVAAMAGETFANCIIYRVDNYGQGIPTIKEGAHHALAETQNLSWRVIQEDGKPALQVRNQGDVHVRLSQVRLDNRTIADGLLGYVLPRSSRSWPLPSGMQNARQISAQINARNTQWQSAPVN